MVGLDQASGRHEFCPGFGCVKVRRGAKIQSRNTGKALLPLEAALGRKPNDGKLYRRY
jgi:hypothetical protein